MRDVSASDGLVNVRLFAAAKAAAGTGELALHAGSLASITEQLTARYAALATVLPGCSFLVDGAQANAEASTLIAAGATVDVLPPFAGG